MPFKEQIDSRVLTFQGAHAYAGVGPGTLGTRSTPRQATERDFHLKYQAGGKFDQLRVFAVGAGHGERARSHLLLKYPVGRYVQKDYVD